jgi:Domain of unknown function (DUF4164)
MKLLLIVAERVALWRMVRNVSPFSAPTHFDPFRQPLSMSSILDQALTQLDAAFGQLEAAAQRRLELDRRRADMETELTLMQDDRARLAVDLDGALSRVQNVESLAGDAVKRIDSAMAAIRDVLVEADA